MEIYSPIYKVSERLNIKDTAKRFGLSEYGLRQGAKEGRYPHIKVGNKYIFDVELLEQCLKQEAKSNLRKADNQSSFGSLRAVKA